MLPLGHVLGETYRVERLLTHGGMAAIYVVAHTRLRRRYALKIIAANLAEQGSLLERFNREADILATLEHPHVVDVIDYNVYQERYPYLVMELLDGEDLSQFLRKQGALDPAVALPIFLQISEALTAAHEAGIVHRDLKPGNVFLCRNGPFSNFTKVLDFGIAKVVNPEAGLQTQNSGLLGTPAYMAPEQVLGPPEAVSEKTDQFALATILYEMLAGKPAFHRSGEPMLRTLNRVCYEDPEPLPPGALTSVIQRALNKNPADRFPTLRAFVDASGALDLTGSMPVLAQRTRPMRASPLSGSAPALSPVSVSSDLLGQGAVGEGSQGAAANSADSPLSRGSQGEVQGPAVTPPARKRSTLGWIGAGSALLTIALLSAFLASRPDAGRRRPQPRERSVGPGGDALRTQVVRETPSPAPSVPTPVVESLPPSLPPRVVPAPSPRPAPLDFSPPRSPGPVVRRSSPVKPLPGPSQPPPAPAPAKVVGQTPPKPAPGPREPSDPMSALPPRYRGTSVLVEGIGDPQLTLIRHCIYTKLSAQLPKLVGHSLRLRYGATLELHYKDRSPLTEDVEECLRSMPIPDRKPLPEVVVRFFSR